MHEYRFKERLKEVRGKESLTAFGKRFGTTRQVIKHYELGERRPDAEMLYNIAKTLNISADYLLGLDDVRTVSKSVKGVFRTTGLNEDSIKLLMEMVEADKAENSMMGFSTADYYNDKSLSTSFGVLNAMLSNPNLISVITFVRKACIYDVGDTFTVRLDFSEGTSEVNARDFYLGMAQTSFQRLLQDIIKANDEQGAE